MDVEYEYRINKPLKILTEYGFYSRLIEHGTNSVFPRLATALGAVWATGRILYQLRYRTRGPNGRRIGWQIGVLSIFSLVFLSSTYG